MTRGDLPPGQQLVAPNKWPLVGERASRPDDSPWTVSIVGRVARPMSWTLDLLHAMPQVARTVDIHCVTRWSKPAVTFCGVELRTLVELAEPAADARFISFVARSSQGHSTSLRLDDALDLGTLISLEVAGQPLPLLHGGPVRVVVPGRYFYKSLKWLETIEVRREDRLGFWESTAGYHNTADPWREQRYIAPRITKQQAAKLIAERDFSHRDLRGIDASGHCLTDLNAENALLRNATFRDCDLRGANFRNANLSNAHFQSSDLRNASFIGADVEGADFSGADLRNADFTGASLFGTSFIDDGLAQPTRIDQSTCIDRQSLEQLLPIQAAFVTSSMQER